MHSASVVLFCLYERYFHLYKYEGFIMRNAICTHSEYYAHFE